MSSLSRTSAGRASPWAAAPLLALALCSACVLDLRGLAAEGAGAAAGTGGGGSGAGGSGGAAGGGGGCSLLECCPEGEAVELAKGPVFADLPRGIAVGKDGVYWASTTGESVVRLPADGGPPEVIAAAPGPRALALSGGTLAWTASDGVYACAAPSCSDAHLVAPSLGAGTLRGLAFDGSTLLFTDRAGGEGDGRARSCALDACAPIDLAEMMFAPEGIALEGGLAFWIDQGNGNQNGVVGRSPKSSASSMQVAAALDLPTGVAVDETYVYWTEQIPGGHVYRCAFAAGYCSVPQDVAPASGGLGRPGDIQIAGGRVYWTNSDDGTIMSCPQPGCGDEAPKVHASGREGLARLAVGSFCLFWTESAGGGAVMKTAR